MMRSLFHRYSLVILFLIPASVLLGQENELTLDEAISIALARNPELLASRLEALARKARTVQAGVIPNPEFGVLTEDFAGSGQFQAFDSSQTTVQLSQRLELGGKRGARRNAAVLNREVAEADLELKRREIITGVRKAFFTVLLGQERMRWMQELLEVSRQFSGAVVERIAAGKIPPIDEVKAQSIVALAQIDLSRSTRELESARYELAAVIGTSEPEFYSVRGEVSPSAEVRLEELIPLIPASADIKKAEIEIEESKALLAVEKSKQAPDLTVTGGYRRLQTTDDSAFVAGINVPIPLFDRNKGAIEEAKNRIQKAEQMKSSVALQLKSSLIKSFHAYSAARLEAEALTTQVLPANQTSFDAISEGYRLGKYGYLDVLEAQRSLFQSRLQLLRTLGDLHSSASDLERITGKHILIFSDQPKGDSQ